MTADTLTGEVVLETRGPLGLITLNRPKALNALTLDMIHRMHPQLDDWAADPAVRAVVIRGAGDRAFCAGGDVLSIWHDGMAIRRGEPGTGMTEDFFRYEYMLDHRIHTFPKPYVSLLDGVTMGGGFGVSVHGSHRVATERTLFAMPETGIGLFPDVGAGWFLPRCPGETGTYLGLTGTRCEAPDCRYIGYATHYVPAERLDALIADLAEADWAGDPQAVTDAVLARHAGEAGAPSLAAQRDAIDRCFRFDTVEAILEALAAEGGDWADQTRRTLLGRSPSSLKMSLRELRLGASMTYADAVTMEYRLSQACMAGNDFFEGIRAQLIDKDRAPKWRPATLEEVPEAAVEQWFMPLGERDLVVTP
jgi:enoyl-CoA hydratase